MFLAGIWDGRASGYPIKAFGYDKSRYTQIPNRTMLIFWHFLTFLISGWKCVFYDCNNLPQNKLQYKFISCPFLWIPVHADGVDYVLTTVRGGEGPPATNTISYILSNAVKKIKGLYGESGKAEMRFELCYYFW